MTTETKTIRVEFREDGSSRVVNGVKKMSGAAKTAESSFASFSKTLLRFASIGAVTVALKKATTAALEFGSAMAEVRTLLDDQSQFERLEQNVRKIALQFGQSPTEQARALYQVVSAGAQDAAKATDILTVSNKLAIAGVTDVSVAADALTTVLNAYGDEVGSAIDVSDAFFVAVKAGKTTMSELARGIGEVSGVAANVGVSFEEILAATAALTKGTLNTAKSMRGLRAVLSAIIKPTEEAIQLTSGPGGLGIAFDAMALKAKGLTKFLADVGEATGNDSALLARLFGNVEGLIPIMALGGKALDDFTANLVALENKTGKTDEALAIMSATMEFKLNKFMVALSIIAIDVGNVLLTGLAPAAELAADNMDVLKVAVVGLTAALAVLKFGAIITGLKWIAFGIKAIATALSGSPLGLLVVGLTAIAVGVTKLNKKFSILAPTWELIKTGFSLMINNIVSGFNTFANTIDKLFSKIKNKVIEFGIFTQEKKVKFLSLFGSDAAFESSVKELESLRDGQVEYNEKLDDMISGRIEANRLIAEENILLSENWDLAKKQLFTEREAKELEEDTTGPDGTNGLPGGATPGLDEEVKNRLKIIELQQKGIQLTKDMRNPMEIFIDQQKELNELLEAGSISTDTYNRAMEKYQEEMEESNKKTEEFGDLFEKAINGTLTAKDIFLIGVRQILNGLFDMNKQAQDTTESFLNLGSSLGGGGGIGSSLGSIVGSIFGSFFSPTPVALPTPPPSINAGGFGLLAADGAVMHRGVQKFADGGVFGSPVSFPMSGGKTGMMAEAGPEAIMPLERAANGRLGVSTSGAAPRVDVQIIDQRSGGQQAQVEQGSDSQGNKQIRVVIRDEVNKGFADGAFDKSMKTFGAQRGGNRR